MLKARVKTGGTRLANMINQVNRPFLFIDTYNQRVLYNMSGTITTGVDFRNNTYISVSNKQNEDMTENKKPIKVRIRKLTETEVFRLMNVDDKYIQRMLNSGVSRTKLYFAAGNSIVVSCMEHIFNNLFYPRQNDKANESKH